MKLRLFSGSLRARLLGLILTAIIPIIGLILFYIFPRIGDAFMQERKEVTQWESEMAYTVIEGYYSRYKQGEISEDRAKDLALDAVRRLRYGNGNYFWIHTVENRVIMHPIKSELVGKDVSDRKDPEGRRLFYDMTEVAKKNGSGFYGYLWQKHDGAPAVPKISFVRLVPEWGWVIGTGLYVEDVQTEISQFRSQVLVVIGIFVFVLLGLAYWLANRLNDTLSSAIRSINENSEGVHVLSKTLADSGQALSSTVTQTATSLQETAASLEQISSMVEKNASNAQKSRDLADACRNSAHRGKDAVGGVKQSIQQILDGNSQIFSTIEHSNREISGIVAMILEIDQKTKVIHDIVFQTRLLSFNAAVEAARAGEHGKGFAVVAEEVGGLAQMSGNAAKEISSTLESSVTKVKAIVEQTLAQTKTRMEEGRKYVEQCEDKVVHCGQVLDEIAEKTEQVTSIVAEIVTACQEQAHGAREISAAVGEVEKSTQINSASANQVAASSVEMDKRSVGLSEVVSRVTELVSGRAA